MYCSFLDHTSYIICIDTPHRTAVQCYLADLDLYRPSTCLRHLLAVPPVLNLLLHLELFVYLHLIIGILSLCISAHLTVLLLLYHVWNLTFLFCLSRLVTHTPAPQIRPSTIDAANLWQRKPQLIIDHESASVNYSECASMETQIRSLFVLSLQ